MLNMKGGDHPDGFTYLHGVALNSLGDVYAAEVSFTEIGQHRKYTQPI